ncbi:MAG: T9SS type A sorting domain-containing protein, partial [Candidatus Latescibacteria bacterium]|nr:T9SS type A sorting domain-containing protein [Candidatus Latescibacterota bacterium]
GGISDGTFRMEVVLPGDFNGDGQVNLSDFSLFVGYYGSTAGDADFDSLYDLDGDGKIGLSDFSIFAGNYGSSVGSAKGMPWTGENHPAASLSMERMDRSEEASGDVKWSVHLNGVGEVKGYSFKVRYDPGRFDFRGAERAPGDGKRGWPLLAQSSTAGEIFVADVVRRDEMLQGGGVLVELCFKDKGAAEDVRFILTEGMFMDAEGEVHALGSAEAISLPKEIALFQNFPNPFNPTTEIRYQLPESSEIQLRVYNLLGQEVRRLVDGRVKAGTHSALWDSRDSLGREVGSGVYLVRMEAGDFVEVRKMALIR